MSIEAKQVDINLDTAAAEREKQEAILKVIETYRDKPGCLIAVLHLAQEIYGYLPLHVQKIIADGMGESLSHVSGVVSFYSYFSTKPRARFEIKICLGTACYVRGGKEVLDALKKKLGVDVGQTTEDRQFSLDIGRCFGACGMAPVLMVNDTVHQRVKPARISELLQSYASDAQPAEVNS